MQRIAELVETQGSLPLGSVDASVIGLTVRLGCEEVATLEALSLSGFGIRTFCFRVESERRERLAKHPMR